MRRIESIETFKKTEIKKLKTRDFYKELSKQFDKEVRPEIENERKQEYKGYREEVKESLYNLETKFHFLDIKKKRNPFQFYILNRREYNRLFKRFKLSDRRIMLKEVNHSNVEIKSYNPKREDSQATIVVNKEYAFEKQEEENNILDKQKTASPPQTSLITMPEKFDQDIEIEEKQNSSDSQFGSHESNENSTNQVQFIFPQDNKQPSENTSLSDDNATVPDDESMKRYNIYGTLAGKGIRSVSLTEEQRDVIEFIQDKQLQRDSKKNMWYVLAYFDMRGTYNKEKKKFKKDILKEKEEETGANKYLESYEQKWHEYMIKAVKKDEKGINKLLESMEEHDKKLSEISGEKEVWLKRRTKLSDKLGELIENEKTDEAEKFIDKHDKITKGVEKVINQYNELEKSHREAFTKALEQVRSEFDARAKLVAARMVPKTLQERERFLKQLYVYSETRIDDMVRAIRSGGNLLANFATMGASSLIHASMSHSLEAQRALPF